MEKIGYKKADWINSTNIYEVNLRQYTIEGSFKAFEKELPRLKDMGVETLWFMPITPIAEKNKKGSLGSYYACSDYISINPEFGTLEDFKNLVTLAHAMNFKVVIDWVANHTGWDHVWTKSHPDYYKKEETTGDFKIASGMDDIIELDFNNPDLRKAMIQAMEYWVRECDIDGFRCDLAFWVVLDFWKEARTHLEKIKILLWLAETDPLENPGYMEVFDAMYTWTWMHKTADFYKQQIDFSVLEDVFKNYDTICADHCMPLWFTSNHDENTWNGTEYEKYGEMAILLAVFSFTRNGMPMIYSGQELPNLKRLDFFDKDVIAWDGRNALHGFYKILLNLHSTNKALRAMDPEVITYTLDPEGEKSGITFLRKKEKSEVLVLLNFSNEEKIFTVKSEHLEGTYKNVFGNDELMINKEIKTKIKPWGFSVYEKS